MDIGIDVGGTNLKAGVVDEQGTILAAVRRPLGTVSGPEPFVRTLVDLTEAAAAEAGASLAQIRSVGIGIPGAAEEGRIVYTCNIPLKDVPVEKLFHRQIPVPVLLGNDADCAAVGEYFCGTGRGTRNFVTVTLGTGIGGGLILGGRLYRGLGMAGEIGHMVIDRSGPLCSCGRRGCWETYASATGLIRMTREAMDRDPDSLLHRTAAENGAVDGRTAFQAAQLGDPAAQEVCQKYVAALAEGITNLVNLLHPEKLAIGGGVSAAPEELLLFPLREQVERACYARHGGRMTRIERAALGNDAGLIGAALLRKAI